MKEEYYDAVVTVGSFGPGHLNENHVDELLRLTKVGGQIVIGNHLLIVVASLVLYNVSGVEAEVVGRLTAVGCLNQPY